MKARPDSSIRRFASEALLRQIKVLQSEIGAVGVSADIEPVHRMRVASRRLHVIASLFANYFPSKSISAWQSRFQKIRRTMGAARDADVQQAFLQEFIASLSEANLRPGIQRLLLRIQQNRANQEKDIAGLLAKVREKKWLDSIQDELEALTENAEDKGVFSAKLYRLANEQISEQLDRLLAHRKAFEIIDNTEELHAMRVTAKQFRYTMETFAPLYPDELKDTIAKVRKLQELLGDIHDRDVWLAYLPQFIETEKAQTETYFGHTRPLKRLLPGIAHFEQCLRDGRQHSEDQLRVIWQAYQDEGLWDELKTIIDRPLSIVQSMYPPALDGRSVSTISG